MTPRGESSQAPAPQASAAQRHAWHSPRAVAVFLIIAALAAAGDLLSKQWAFDHLLGRPQTRQTIDRIISDPRVEVKPTPEFTRAVLQEAHLTHRVTWGLSLTASTNPGVVFGFDRLPRWVVNVVTVIAVVVIALMFAFSARRDRWLQIALALILGGAVGNLYDRLFSRVALPGLATPIRHHVRDFIDCSEIGYVWIFNLADAWLVIGVIMIGLHWACQTLREHKEKKT